MKVIIDDEIPILDVALGLDSVGCIVVWTADGLRITRKPKRKRRTKAEMKKQ